MSENDKNIAIKVSNVSKTFILPHEQQNTLKSRFVNFYKRKKGFEKQKVLDNISFEIKKGEFFGIVGRNGSGKSTLLKLLSGIYTPDSGDIKINGKLTPFIELGVGFNPELSGRENVFLNGALLGFNRKEMEAMYDEIVEFAELERFMDQKLKNYSSGMQVRLAFSIAIRANSDILVLDEVLAVGDANFQKKCFDYFRQLKENKKTVILVSHDMESVRRFSNRALLLEDGSIISINNPETISQEYIRRNLLKSNPSKDGAKGEIHYKYLTSVTINDFEDDDLKSVYGDKELDINIAFNKSTRNNAFNIGVGLYSRDYGYVFGYNTQMDKITIAQQNGVLRLKLNKLNLLNGEYYINLVCFENEETTPLEFQAHAVSFQVQNTGEKNNYRGTTFIEHNWAEIK